MKIAPPLQQSPEFARACAAMGVPCREIALPFGGAACAILRRLPLLGTVALVSRGPVFPGPAPCDWPARLRGAAPPTLLLNAVRGCPARFGAAGYLPLVTPASVALLDLAGDRDARRARLHPKWRNRLARAEAAPLAIRHCALPADPGHWLLRAEAAQQRARGYRGLPPALAAAFAHANPGGARLFTAESGGRTVAAMLFLRHGPMVTYQIGRTTPAGRACHAHQRLLFEAADWLARHGHACLDLGTVDTETAPGLARFKLDTGARLQRLGGTWLAHPATAPAARLLAALAPRPPLPAKRPTPTPAARISSAPQCAVDTPPHRADATPLETDPLPTPEAVQAALSVRQTPPSSHARR